MNNIMLFIIVGWLSSVFGFLIASVMASGKIEDAYSEGMKNGFNLGQEYANALER